MIAFDLQCEEGHTFEAWFKDRQAYEEQLEQGLLECPVCGSSRVRKILSPVALKKSGRQQPGPSDGEAGAELFYRAMSRVYENIIQNTEDVGTRFAAEALKMHYGVKEHRNIRGVATEEEEKMLKDEGIEFMKIPVPGKPKKDQEH